MKHHFFLVLYCVLFPFFNMLYAQRSNDGCIDVILKDNIHIYVYQQADRMSDIIDTLYSDTLGSINTTLSIYEKNNAMYQIKYYNEAEEIISGWIGSVGLSILTIPNRNDETNLYKENNANSVCLTIKGFFQEWVDVLDIDMRSKWLKILWIDGQQYWLPIENQCANGYTACNGA